MIDTLQVHVQFLKNSDLFQNVLTYSAIGTAFAGTSSNIKAISTFNEYQYFTGQTSLANNAFSYSNIREITFPNTIRSIGRFAFGQCWQLPEMVLPEGITTTAAEWIFGSFRVALIDFPSTMTSIIGYGLAPHTGPSYQVNYNVIIRAVTPPAVDSNITRHTNKLIAIYVPDESVDVYKTATNWSGLASKIKPISEYAGG